MQETAELIESPWNSEQKPHISVQFLQEFFANISRFLEPDEAIDLVEIYKNWNVIDSSVPVFEKAVLIYRKHKLSFWNSLIVSASDSAGQIFFILKISVTDRKSKRSGL